MRDRGLNDIEALMEACRKRARPIVMTTLAMMAGMAPVAVGIDPSTSFRSPMAVSVIGGLLTSTVLSLVVIPVVFTYILKISAFANRLFPSAHLTEEELDESPPPAAEIIKHEPPHIVAKTG